MTAVLLHAAARPETRRPLPIDARRGRVREDGSARLIPGREGDAAVPRWLDDDGEVSRRLGARRDEPPEWARTVLLAQCLAALARAECVAASYRTVRTVLCLCDALTETLPAACSDPGRLCFQSWLRRGRGRGGNRRLLGARTSPAARRCSRR